MPTRPSVHRPNGSKAKTREQAERERKARFERTRPSATDRGYTAAWAKASKAFLAEPRNRLCVCGCGRPADMVDHRRPHKGDMRLFWDRSNWQPMASHPCHSRKTASEDGGFGNAMSQRSGTDH